MDVLKKKKRLQKFLQDAHYSQDDLQIPDGWQSVVMTHIREIDTTKINVQNNFMYQVERAVWQLAPLTAILLIATCIALRQVDLVPGGDIFQLIAYESDDLHFWPG